jgi:ferric-dicitrate binding protein FerR (iron transport regulator)
MRGTQFVTNVDKDRTTTLTVLEGSVEFSDLNKKKTVVVKKNQTSVVKPGGLPSEPVSIDEKRIPIWWE